MTIRKYILDPLPKKCLLLVNYLLKFKRKSIFFRGDLFKFCFLFRIFPNMKSHGTLMKQLFDIQTNEDAFDRRTTENRQRSLPRQAVIEYFKTNCSLDVDSNEGKQIMNYLKNPILQHAIYGILLYNSAREVKPKCVYTEFVYHYFISSYRFSLYSIVVIIGMRPQLIEKSKIYDWKPLKKQLYAHLMNK